MKYLSSLFVFLSVLLLGACRQSETDRILSQADRMYELYPDSAYLLLKNLNPEKLINPKQQARYALLYAKAQYKNYVDAPNDSLINIAVDYAEAKGEEKDRFYAYLYQGLIRYELQEYSKATESLLRALANSDYVDDHFSKGQMYIHLALVNGVQHCSDELLYASKACEEYKAGGLDVYVANAKTILALAYIHQLKFDSARSYLDEAIACADSLNDSFSLLEALSAKANYAILVDSLFIAKDAFDELASNPSYTMRCGDYCNLAYLNARFRNFDKASEYLSSALKACVNYNDTTLVLVKTISIYKILGDQLQVDILKDSLISYQDNLIEENGKHTSLAYQRDYTEWQKLLVEEKAKKRSAFLVSVLAIFLLLLSLLYHNYKKKDILSKLQSAKIEKLQAQIQLQSTKIESGIIAIRESEVVSYFHELVLMKGKNSIKRWSELESLYTYHLPHFEQTLRELYSLSTLEWHLCMLLKLGFTPGEMSVLLNRSPATISIMRSRLYVKVFNKKGTPADWDTFVMSI